MLVLSSYQVPRPWLALVGGTLGIACGIAGLGLSTTLPQALTLLAVAGVSAAVMNVQLSVVSQLHIPPDVMGRAYGVISSLSSAHPARRVRGGCRAPRVVITDCP